MLYKNAVPALYARFQGLKLQKCKLFKIAKKRGKILELPRRVKNKYISNIRSDCAVLSFCPRSSFDNKKAQLTL